MLQLRTVPYDHQDASRLIAEVQQEYVRRYGDPDITPVDPAQFAPPHGLFLVGYLDGEPVVCGGWRTADADDEHVESGDAEMKRVYVVPAARGRGLARLVLAELERTAATAGHTRMILETGSEQPEAIALYTSAGYRPTAKFGVYRHHANSVCLAKALPSTSDQSLPGGRPAGDRPAGGHPLSGRRTDPTDQPAAC